MIEAKAGRSEGLKGPGDSPHHGPEAVISGWLGYAQSALARKSWSSAIVVIRLEDYVALEEGLPANCLRLLMDELVGRVRRRVPGYCDVINWSAREVAFFARSGMSMRRIRTLATALRQDLDGTLSVSGTTALAVTTIGVVQIDRGTTGEVKTVLDCINQALLRAARLSEDRFAVYDRRYAQPARSRLEMHGALRTALHNGGLTLAYQPIRELSTGKIVALEALARWKDPTLGDVSPSSFLVAAEEAGLIGILEKWVVRTACQQLREWRDLGYFDLMMSVNVSATQFTSYEFGLEEPLLRALDENALPPAALQIEITEFAVNEDAARTMLRSIQRLRRLGTRFVIDDFGTGYSSLSRIHRLPINGIKIDRSFVSGLSRRDKSRQVASAIIALARELDLEVIAEGVERNTHCRILAGLGCRFGQGYLLGRPLPPADIPALLASRMSDDGTPEQQQARVAPEKTGYGVDDRQAEFSSVAAGA